VTLAYTEAPSRAARSTRSTTPTSTKRGTITPSLLSGEIIFHRMSESLALTPVARARLGLAQLEFRRSLDAALERQLGKPDFTPVD
jgi:hypothetical protein